MKFALFREFDDWASTCCDGKVFSELVAKSVEVDYSSALLALNETTNASPTSPIVASIHAIEPAPTLITRNSDAAPTIVPFIPNKSWNEIEQG